MAEPVQDLTPELTRINDWPFTDDPDTIAASVDAQGFLVLRYAGLDQLVAQAYAASRAFFALPQARKEALDFRAQPQGEFGNVGYIPPDLETAVGAATPDPKEFFHIGRIEEADDPLVSSYGLTPRPDAGDFPTVFRALYRRLDEVGQDVVRCLMASLGADPETARSVMRDGHSILRSLHYPPIGARDREPPPWRAAPHVGIQMVGVQLPPSDPGLQFDTPWGWVEPDFGQFEDCLFVNIGQMLGAFSAGRFPPTLHRVRNPYAHEEDRGRYSIVFFCHSDLRGRARAVAPGGEETDLGERWGDRLLRRLKELKFS